jgi:uncharacterized protein YbaA (DUF1428 family)
MSYVDGFVILVPKSKVKAYARLAKIAGKVWREHGALDYRECIQDDVDVKFGRPFPKLAKPKKGEVIFFSYILYSSRAHRDRVNTKVMADPRMKGLGDMASMPFDIKRLSFGGFKVLVEA